MGNEENIYGAFEAAVDKSNKLWESINKEPNKHTLLTGDRPTGSLHLGHYFGTLRSRVRLQNLGITTFVVIADYQVLTDRDAFEQISENILELTIDYLACGLDPLNKNTYIFPHSHVPELNQLLLPFLTLVTAAELERNPTVKEEINAAGLKRINAGMLTYPVHQAADILFCNPTAIPVGKDQLPHIELTRTIARRFNNRYASGAPVFSEPTSLLSEAPVILGLDGSQKMSKSRGNAIFLKSTNDETAKLIKKAKTDSERRITYDPINRPEVSNLLLIASLVSEDPPEKIADLIGDGGSGRLKSYVTELINDYFLSIRDKRNDISKDKEYIRRILISGIDRAREVASNTLNKVRNAMKMEF